MRLSWLSRQQQTQLWPLPLVHRLSRRLLMRLSSLSRQRQTQLWPYPLVHRRSRQLLTLLSWLSRQRQTQLWALLLVQRLQGKAQPRSLCQRRSCQRLRRPALGRRVPVCSSRSLQVFLLLPQVQVRSVVQGVAPRAPSFGKWVFRRCLQPYARPHGTSLFCCCHLL